MPLVNAKNLQKTYIIGDINVQAIKGIDFAIKPASFVSFVGPSGSGKSTLLNMIGCLDTPDAGSYRLKGREIARLDDDDLARIRNDEIGFVFQTFNLLPRMTALANVEVPLIYAGVKRRERERRAREVLQTVGLGDRVLHRPSEMSGGQRQRVAVARALVTHPSILLADEPTGNLDSATGREIMSLFDRLHSEGNTLIVVTHEPHVARHARRVIHLSDGNIVKDEQQGARS